LCHTPAQVAVVVRDQQTSTTPDRTDQVRIAGTGSGTHVQSIPNTTISGIGFPAAIESPRTFGP